MGMVVLVYEIVFIQSKGTQMTRIARIRTDFFASLLLLIDGRMSGKHHRST